MEEFTLMASKAPQDGLLDNVICFEGQPRRPGVASQTFAVQLR